MLRTDDDLIVPLRDVGTTDAARVGCKAATLGELLRAGFPVPDGAVLTTAALKQALVAAGLDATATPEEVDTVQVPDGAAEALPRGPLAVRSSGVEEDRPDASYAGQYETVLGVVVDDLPAAVRRCWASAFRPQVAAYHAARDGGSAPEMAVLIQPMVPADAAGVAFSADPVTGDRDTVMVSAVRGLGDRLVGGAVSPDEWVVRDGAVTCRAAPEGALDAGTVHAVATLARRVAAHLGGPQDIEWALAGGALVLLQARPITALPDPAPAPVPVPGRGAARILAAAIRARAQTVDTDATVGDARAGCPGDPAPVRRVRRLDLRPSGTAGRPGPVGAACVADAVVNPRRTAAAPADPGLRGRSPVGQGGRLRPSLV